MKPSVRCLDSGLARVRTLVTRAVLSALWGASLALSSCSSDPGSSGSARKASEFSGYLHTDGTQILNQAGPSPRAARCAL
jgi:hypothetical protein